MSSAVTQFHEEEAIGKGYDLGIARRLLRYLKPYLRVLGPALVLTLVLNALRITQPKFTQYAIDWYILPRDLAGLKWLALVFLGVLLLTLPKQSFLTAGMETTLASSLGLPLRLRIVRPNYVNTAVVVSNLDGRQLVPLVVEYPIEKGGVFREMAYYTSAHPALLSPELVKAGQTYVRTMLDLAAKRLKEKGIIVAPQIIDVAERLCVVEHVDHDRFRRESRLALYEEVYALFALNELDTYRFSVSFAGAGGMVQMIPSTYQMVRQRHPGVGLNPDFVLGMRNHGNALEAMLLYMRDTWTDLALNSEVDYALKARLATQPELLSAGYNSNPARLPLYLRRGGASWRTLIPRETQMYLQIYRSLESLVPVKGREAVVSGQ